MNLCENLLTKRPIAASHSRDTKPPCWRVIKVALTQDNLIVISFVYFIQKKKTHTREILPPSITLHNQVAVFLSLAKASLGVTRRL